MILVLTSCVVLFVTVGRGTLLALSDTVLFATKSEARLGPTLELGAIRLEEPDEHFFLKCSFTVVMVALEIGRGALIDSLFPEGCGWGLRNGDWMFNQLLAVLNMVSQFEAGR